MLNTAQFNQVCYNTDISLSTIALQSQLEGIVQQTLSLLTELQHFGSTTTTVYSQLEANLQSLIALQSLLEARGINSLSLITQLEKFLKDNIALTSKLQAKKWRREVYHDNQKWIKETLH